MTNPTGLAPSSAPKAMAGPDPASEPSCTSCDCRSDRTCLRWAKAVEGEDSCPSWEKRNEHGGWTLWEILAREG